MDKLAYNSEKFVTESQTQAGTLVKEMHVVGLQEYTGCEQAGWEVPPQSPLVMEEAREGNKGSGQRDCSPPFLRQGYHYTTLAA